MSLPRRLPFHRLLSTPGKVAFGVALLLLALLPARAQATKEYQVKAAFLYNFTKFVDWPDSRFRGKHAPIVIGVYGSNPFHGALAEAVRGRTVNGRSIQVRNVTQTSDLAGTHVLFVPAGETRRAAGLSDVLRRHSVLAVGEAPSILDQGGAIAFTLEGDKVRFDINRAAAEAANLRISAQLLKLARSVRGRG